MAPISKTVIRYSTDRSVGLTMKGSDISRHRTHQVRSFADTADAGRKHKDVRISMVHPACVPDGVHAFEKMSKFRGTNDRVGLVP